MNRTTAATLIILTVSILLGAGCTSPNMTETNYDSPKVQITNIETQFTNTGTIIEFDYKTNKTLTIMLINPEGELVTSTHAPHGPTHTSLTTHTPLPPGNYTLYVTDTDDQKIMKTTLTIPQKPGINLVLVIDISESTREGAFGAGIEGTTILDQEKANAVNLIRNLESGDRVSAVGFGGTGFTILPSAGGWVEQRDGELLVEEIRRLTPQSGGGTLLFEGLSEAETKLVTVGGTKSVVVLSDGGIKDVDQAEEQIQLLRDQGAEIVFVKVRSGVTGNNAINRLANKTNTPLKEIYPEDTVNLSEIKN